MKEKTKRTKFEIMRDILRLLSRSEGKTVRLNQTQILYKMNISYEMFKRYIKFCMDKGYIETIMWNNASINPNRKYNFKTYKITEKGQEMLNRLSNLTTQIRLEGL